MFVLYKFNQSMTIINFVDSLHLSLKCIPLLLYFRLYCKMIDEYMELVHLI